MSAKSAINRTVVFRRAVETLAVVALGGVTLGWLGLPAGYLSGAILIIAAAALKALQRPPTFQD